MADKVSDKLNSAIENFKRDIISAISEKDDSVPQPMKKPSRSAVQQRLDQLYVPYSSPRFGEPSSSKTVSFRATKRPKVVDIPIFKSVILLKTPDADSIIRKGDRDTYSELGLVKPGLQFNKNHSESQTNDVIREAFETFPEICNFTWMYECGSTKLIPISSMDGFKLSQLYNQKKFIYIRPSDVLKFPHSKKRKRSSEEMPPLDEMPDEMPAPEVGSDDDDMREALARSLLDFDSVEKDEDVSTSVTPWTPCDAKDVLESVAKKITEGNARSLIIVRQDPLGSAFQGMSRSTFDPKKKIHIIFADDVEGNFREEGVDTGGLRREFFSLALRTMENYHVFVGNPKYICYDADALRENKYYFLGLILGKTLLEGGPSPAFFHENFFNLLLENFSEIKMDPQCLPAAVAEQLRQIHAAPTQSALIDCISEQMLINVGISYPLTLQCKETVISDIMAYYLISCLHAPIIQLREGLKVNGLYQEIVAYPHLFKNLFVASKGNVENLHDIFCVVRSEKGSNNFALESKAFAFWMSFVDDCEEGLLEVTPEGNAIIDRKKEVKFDGTATPLQPLTDEEVATRCWKKVTCSEILMFATGASNIPILGFKKPPTIEFLLGPVKQENVMPEANTCSPTLYLPVANKSYELFAARFIYALHFCKKFHKM